MSNLSSSVANLFIGILRGMGYQSFSAVTDFIALWVINVPLTLILTFGCGYGFIGIWASMMTANLILVAVNILAVSLADWKKLALEASQSQLANGEIGESS